MILYMYVCVCVCVCMCVYTYMYRISRRELEQKSPEVVLHKRRSGKLLCT